MTEDQGSQYNDSNRAFLQAFLARSVLTLDDAKPILAAIMTAHGLHLSPKSPAEANSLQERRETLPEDVTEADFNSYIYAANDAISSFDLEIRATYHQTSRLRVYALVNSTSDPIIQLATTHTADEISFLKRVLDAMFETNNTRRREVMAISSMHAVRLCKAPTDNSRETQNESTTQGSSGQSLTMVQAEKMLKTLVDEGWFEKSKKGFYTLSPRGLMELRGWLMETYNDPGDDDDEEDNLVVMRIKQCFACKEIITVGQRCPKLECHFRLHDICKQNFFRVQKSTQCPLCRTDWTNNQTFVGERAAASTNNQSQGRRWGGSTSSSKKKSRTAERGANEALDGEDREEEHGSEEND